MGMLDTSRRMQDIDRDIVEQLGIIYANSGSKSAWMAFDQYIQLLQEEARMLEFPLERVVNDQQAEIHEALSHSFAYSVFPYTLLQAREAGCTIGFGVGGRHFPDILRYILKSLRSTKQEKQAFLQNGTPIEALDHLVSHTNIPLSAVDIIVNMVGAPVDDDALRIHSRIQDYRYFGFYRDAIFRAFDRGESGEAARVLSTRFDTTYL